MFLYKFIAFLIFYFSLETVHSQTCNSAVPVYSNVEMMINGELHVKTTLFVELDLNTDWCITMGKTVNIDGKTYGVNETGDIKVSLGKITAEHYSTLMGYIYTDIPTGEYVHCTSPSQTMCVWQLSDDSRPDDELLAIQQSDWEQHNEDTGNIDNFSFWIAREYASGYVSIINSYNQGNGYSNVVKLRKDSAKPFYIMSRQFAYNYPVTLTGTGIFRDVKSSSTGTIGKTYLSGGEGNDNVAVFLQLDDTMSSSLPGGSMLYKVPNSVNILMTPESWARSSFGCLDPSTPGWLSGGTDALVGQCFRNNIYKMKGWWKSVNGQSYGNPYVITPSADMIEIPTKFSMISNVGGHIIPKFYEGTQDTLKAYYTLKPEGKTVRLTAILPPRKLTIYRDIATCVLRNCSTLIAFSSDLIYVACDCSIHTPGELEVITRGKFNQSTVVQMTSSSNQFNVRLPTADNDYLSVCTSQGCIMANITRINDTNPFKSGEGDIRPGEDKSLGGNKDEDIGFDFKDFLGDLFTFGSLGKLIQCIKDGATECIVGSLFGSLINLLFIFLGIFGMYKGYKWFKGRQDVSHVLTMKTENTAGQVNTQKKTHKAQDEQVELVENPCIVKDKQDQV